MSYVVDVAIEDVFILRDNIHAAITGKVSADFTTLEAYLVGTPATTAAITLTEIGGGEYGISFTPTVTGKWIAHVLYNSGGVFVEYLEPYIVEDDEDVATSPTPGTITTGIRLCDIRAGVARLCQDWVRFIATSASADTSVFFDNDGCYENDNHFRGSQLWFDIDSGTAANQGTIVRVTGSSLADLSLSLGSGLTSAPTTGDVAFAYNIGGMGDRISTYDAVINDAIRGLGRAAEIPYTDDLVDVWDIDAPWVDIPDEFTALSSAQYYESDDIWYDIPGHAMAVDLVQRKVAFSADYTYLADTKYVRLIGKTRHPDLELDTDLTPVGYEWIVNEVASQILLNKRDQVLVNKGGMRKNNADALRGTASQIGLLENSIRLP